MDCQKTGQTICHLRKEKGLTQRELADRLRVSPKTVSKWEQGHGCPDVSLWRALAEALGADLLKLLQGEIAPSRRDPGKIPRAKFFACPLCGSLYWGTGNASLTCCARQIRPLPPQSADLGHTPAAQEADGEAYLTLSHPMAKTHYIAFAALVQEERVLFIRLYPEQAASFTLPFTRGRGTLYLYCTAHGLMHCPYPIEQR